MQVTDIRFFPQDGSYVPFPGIFATWVGTLGDTPNPCRKYHISADPESASGVAEAVLPELRAMRLHHKVVATLTKLLRMQEGKQAGKFITVYAPIQIDQADFVARLSGALARSPGLRPSPTIPKSRQYAHQFIELPLDDALFIYGGYEIDPTV